MGRIAEIAHIRRQDGAISGSRSTFLEAQVEVPKGVMLGPYRIDVGEAKKANKGSVLGVQNGVVLGVQNGVVLGVNSSHICIAFERAHAS